MKSSLFDKGPLVRGPGHGLAAIWEENSKLAVLSRWDRVRQLVGEAFKSFWAAPLATVLALLSSIVTIYILAALMLVLENVARTLESSQNVLTMSVYLKEGMPQEQVEQLLQWLRARPEIAEAAYLSKSAALESFRKELGGQSDLLEGLSEQNPLPASVELRLRTEYAGNPIFESLAQDLQGRQDVDTVQYSQGLIGQFSALLHFFQRWAALAVALMLLGTGFVIASTIKLALYSRRDEVSIMRLVGAPTFFVQIPCLLEGLLQGVISAGCALLALYFSLQGLRQVIEAETLLAAILPPLNFLSCSLTLLIFVACSLVGILGSYLAVRQVVHA